VRNRYLDLLRAAAIARVIVYHLFGWPWLSIVLPAMGVMFALAGSLTAASLDKRAAGKVITSRLRRLLPPLWVLGLIAVPAMLYAGWAHEPDGTTPFSLPRLAFWILPVGDPPGSDKGVDAWEPLWYLRAYLWFVVLSPVMYRAYRKAGWLAVAAPIVLIAVLDKTGFSLPDTADAAMWDFATFGACWIIGFAHHDGRLARLQPWLVVTGAVVLGAAALYWLQGHQGGDAWDLNDVSESQSLWSLAFVLLVLRWQPPMEWLARLRALDAAVTFLNARAVTVYLWHNIAIAAIWPVLTVLTLDDLGILEHPVDLAATVLLTLLAAVAFGWVEDLAARRRPQLWPSGRPSRGAPSGGEPGRGGSGRGGSGPGEASLREPGRGGAGPVRATVGEPLSDPPGPAEPPAAPPRPAPPRPAPALPVTAITTRSRRLGSPMAPSLPTGWGRSPIVATTTSPPVNESAAGPVDDRNSEFTEGPRHAVRGAGEAAQAPWSPATRGHDADDDPAPPAWFGTGPEPNRR
jgi:peptidoglycan/LPS O-acetylase OafA/YrhL